MKTNIMQNLSEEEINALEWLRDKPVGVSCRVKKWLAQKWLEEDKSVISSGKVHWFNIKSIGLEIFEISKAETSQKHTLLVK